MRSRCEKVIQAFTMYSTKVLVPMSFDSNLGSVINYGAKMVNVSCSSRQYMKIKSANYGDFNKNGVFHDDQNVATICSAVTTCRMKSRCNGNRFCELTIDNSLLPSQHCSDNSKEIYTKYTCGDTNSLSPITEGNSCDNWNGIFYTWLAPKA